MNTNENSLHEQLMELGANEIATYNAMIGSDDSNYQYSITATRKQTAMLSEACNTMARLEIAQINALLDVLPLRDNVNHWELLQKLEVLLSPYLKTSRPLSNYFPMHQALRHRLSWDKYPEGGMTVNFDEPLMLDDTPLLLIANLNMKELTQNMFIDQPNNIRSAHIDSNGTAFLNECFIEELRVVDGQHICMTADLWQKPIGTGYKTQDWQFSPINRNQ